MPVGAWRPRDPGHHQKAECSLPNTTSPTAICEGARLATACGSEGSGLSCTGSMMCMCFLCQSVRHAKGKATRPSGAMADAST